MVVGICSCIDTAVATERHRGRGEIKATAQRDMDRRQNETQDKWNAVLMYRHRRNYSRDSEEEEADRQRYQNTILR